jgi:DNA-binding NarL/FixJ family response regulator
VSQTGTSGGAGGAFRPRVVVADDERILRESLCDLLDTLGFDVIASLGNGAEAVSATEELNPDLVLLDLRMPVMDGIEATRLIKQALPTTEVIMLSAYEEAGLQRSAEEVGVYCYLVKGCTPSLMRDVLMQAARSKRQEDARLRRHRAG